MRPNSPNARNKQTPAARQRWRDRFRRLKHVDHRAGRTGKLLADPAVNRRHQTPRRTGRGVRLRRLTLIDFALAGVSGGDAACRAQPTRPALPVQLITADADRAALDGASSKKHRQTVCLQ
jgi:hypothetical protein